MKLIVALSALSIVIGATASGNNADHPSLRHARSMQDACTGDVKECEDGSFVDRNPEIDCDFNPCPEDLPGACQLDVKECEDGSFVDRNPEIDCDFNPCPEDLPGACQLDVKECEDGSFVNRDPDNDCEFAPCPEEELACAMDVQECSDGSFVSRDPAKNCEFEACPKVCTGEDGETYVAPCEGIDGMFCIGESFTALDGCNTCSCSNMDGLAACTVMFCPPEPAPEVLPEEQDMAPKPCLVNGLQIDPGQSYVASDGCNTCTCTDAGVSVCTEMACEPCSTCDGNDGNTYCAGESFLSGDGCNTCRCSDTGAASCTKMACPSPENATKESGTCLVNGIEYAKGEAYTADDGCNTCTCSGGDTPDACTMAACEPCTTCEDGGEVYCSGVTYLASDGCNRCTCGENGFSACTMMACPEEPTEVQPAEPGDEMPDGMPSGSAGTTSSAPAEPGDDTPDVMPMPIDEDTTSGAISASIGLSTIAAFLSFLGAAM